MTDLTPTLSRPAPQIAAPIVHQGVRYQQDREGTPGKEPGAAYLVAIDPASERLLWSLKIADGIHHPPGSPWALEPGYFATLEARDDSLFITLSTGKKYQMELKSRKLMLIYDPANATEPDERRNWGDNPPPPPLPK